MYEIMTPIVLNNNAKENTKKGGIENPLNVNPKNSNFSSTPSKIPILPSPRGIILITAIKANCKNILSIT